MAFLFLFVTQSFDLERPIQGFSGARRSTRAIIDSDIHSICSLTSVDSVIFLNSHPEGMGKSVYGLLLFYRSCKLVGYS